MARPPRHDDIPYIGRETFLITVNTRDRVNAFADYDFGREVLEQLVQHANKRGFSLPAYTLLEDHGHVVTRGETDVSDVDKLISKWKQSTGYAWSRKGHGRLWQPGYWDSHLRRGESVFPMIEYVFFNPVRAGLVTDPAQYPLTGSTLYSMDELRRLMGVDKCQPIAVEPHSGGPHSGGPHSGGTKVPPSR